MIQSTGNTPERLRETEAVFLSMEKKFLSFQKETQVKFHGEAQVLTTFANQLACLPPLKKRKHILVEGRRKLSLVPHPQTPPCLFVELTTRITPRIWKLSPTRHVLLIA